MTDNCKLFGLRSDEESKSKRCIGCKENSSALYKKCSIESRKFFNTSIIVNDEGKTEFVPYVPQVIKPKIHEIKNCPNESLKGNKMVIPEDPKEVHTERKETKGVLQIAKQMITDGKPDGKIFEALIKMYMNDGKTPKQAKKNAHCAIFNAKKKLGIKKESRISEESAVNEN